MINTRSRCYDWNTNQRIRKLSIIILIIFHDIDKFCVQLQTLKIFVLIVLIVQQLFF